MDKNQQRFFLILELLKECEGLYGEILGLTPSNGGGYVIPSEEKEQEELLDKLLHIRAPYAFSEEFAKIWNDYNKK